MTIYKPGLTISSGSWVLGNLSTDVSHVIQAAKSTNGNILQIIGAGSAGAYLGVTELAVQSYYIGMDDGSSVLKIRPTTTLTASIAEATAAGAWTFGPSGATTNLHSVNGGTTFYKSTGGTLILAQDNTGSSGSIALANSGSGDLRIWDNGFSNILGTCTQAGAWTFGPTSDNAALHCFNFQGYPSSTAGMSVMRVLQTSGNNRDVLRIESNTASSVNFDFIKCINDADGTPSEVFSVRGDGACQFGQASGGSVTHTFNCGVSNHQVYVRSGDDITSNFPTDSTDRGSAIVLGRPSDTSDDVNFIASYITASKDNMVYHSRSDQVFMANNAEIGRALEDGAWALGPSTPSSSVTQIIKGYAPGADGALFVRDYNTVLANPVMRIVTSAVTDSTSNKLINFNRNVSTTAGAIVCDGAGGADFGTYSDERLKENFRPLSGILDKICRLDIRYYDRINGSKDCIGDTAQNMQEIFPECVSIDNGTAEQYLQVAGWGQTDYKLAKAVQELKTELDEAKEIIIQQNLLIGDLQEQIDELKV